MNQPTEFKTAAIGGFNRQDVIDYITRQAEEKHRQEEEWSARRQELEGRLSALEQENQQLTALLEESSRAVTEADTRIAELTEELSRRAGTEEENAALHRQVDELKPDAEAYGHIKDSLAEMELSARSRADEIVKRAELTGWQACEQAEAQLAQVREQYHAAQVKTDAAMEHALRSLVSIRDIMRDMTQTFRQCDEVIEGLRVPREET